MKVNKIREVAEAIGKIKDERLPYGLAAAVYALRKAIAAGIEFFSAEEMAIAREFAKGEIDAQGRFALKEGRETEYVKKVAELLDTEVPVQWETVKVKAPDAISVEIISAFDGLIEFEEE